MAFVTAAAACLVADVLLSVVYKLTRWQDYLKAVRSTSVPSRTC